MRLEFATHTGKVIKEHLDELFSYEDVQKLNERLKEIAHPAVYAGFGTQPAKGVFAAELDGGRLDAHTYLEVSISEFRITNIMWCFRFAYVSGSIWRELKLLWRSKIKFNLIFERQSNFIHLNFYRISPT